MYINEAELAGTTRLLSYSEVFVISGLVISRDNLWYVYNQKNLIWIIRTIPLFRTAYKTSLPKGVRITGVGLYKFVRDNRTHVP